MVSETLNIEVNEFTVAGIPYDSLFAHRWYIGTDDEVDRDHFRELLDEKLKILNDDYRVERNSALKEIFVEIIPSSIFYNWMNINNKVGAQNKFPRVMKNLQFTQWEDFVHKELEHH